LAVTLGSAARGGRVTLEWDPTDDPDVTGYRVKYGTSPGLYNHTVEVARATTATISHLVESTPYFFVVVAYDYRGILSQPSNPVSYIPLPEEDDAPLLAAYSGGYTGSIVEGSGGNNAYVSIKLTVGGAFTGRVMLGNTSARLRGWFGLNGRATVKFLNNGLPRTLVIELDTGTGELAAVIPGVNGEISISLLRTVAPHDNVPGGSGAYMLILGQFQSMRPDSGENPQGIAIAQAVVSATGSVRTTGRLADGQRFMASSQLDEFDGFDLYALPYTAPPGILAGRIQLNNDSETGEGSLWWFKPPQAVGSNRTGFDGLVSVALSGLVR
jgi:hypothetical protein